jgi:hypothetical protein
MWDGSSDDSDDDGIAWSKAHSFSLEANAVAPPL